MEQKFLKLKADYAVLESERDTLVEQKQASANEIKQVQDVLAVKEADIARVNDDLLQLRTEREQLAFQVKTATSLAERRLSEIEELQQAVKERSTQLIEAQRKEVEAIQRAAEHETQAHPLRLTTERLTKELETQKQHVDWMEKQLTEKTKTVQDLRQSVAKFTHEVEDLKIQHTEEMTALQRQLDSARQVSKKLESSLVHAQEQVKEAQAAKMHDEERFQNELSAQRRLAELYKESADDAASRVQDLQTLCESLRQSLSEADDALAHETERTKQQVEHLFQEQSAYSERRIEELQEELKDARSLIDELQRNKLVSLQTGAAAASLSSAASDVHLAAHGLSSKELYDQILQLEASLRDEQEEKEKLRIYMDRIVKELHEKAPMILSLKLEHERAVASHAQVSERLEVCMQELEQCRVRESKAYSEKTKLEHKSEALAKSVEDLSRQVQHLLFRSHEHSQSQRTNEGSVSENLLLFDSVEQLQVRNQQLIMVIRELSEKRSSENQPYHEAGALALSSDDGNTEVYDRESQQRSGERLTQALKELAELRNEREEERQMISAIVKQRDMYRVLLAQADSKFVEDVDSDVARSKSTGNTHHERRSSSDLTESRLLRELQKEFEDYKKEKSANLKLVQDALDKARSDMSEVRLAQMQAEVEAKCNKERHEAADKRRQDAEDEVMRLRSKTEHLNSLLLQHQQLLAETEAKLEATLTRLRIVEVEKEGSLREISFLKKHEDKVLQELSALRVDNTNLLKLMETQRQIEQTREEREERETQRLQQKLALVESKLQDAYDKLDANDALAGARLAETEQAKTLAVGRCEALQEDLAKVREQIIKVEEQKKTVETKASLLEKEVAHLREQLRKGTNIAAAERIATLELQLRKAQQEVLSSIEMKKSLTEAVAKYKAIADANEKSLNELSSASQKWRVALEEKVRSVEAEREGARDELAKVRAQLKESVDEGNRIREDIEVLEREHQAAMKSLDEKHRSLQGEATAARTEVLALREEASRLREDVASAQDNYERELKLHASEVEKFAASRKLVAEEQKRRHELQVEIAELNTRLLTAEKESSTKLKEMEILLADAIQAKAGLAEQNKLLHTQLDRTSQELRRAHENELIKRVGSAASGPTSSHDSVEHVKEVDDLRSVISFLRKENEITSSKLSLAQQEAQRYRGQIAQLEATIEGLRDDLKRLEASSISTTPADSSDAAKKSALLQQLDLLRESNATLRDECQKNLARFKAEEERVKVFESRLAPLQESEIRLQAESAALKQEITSLQEANKRWKTRVEQLVEKYQQIDPAEYEKVCAEKEAIAKELSSLQAKETALNAEIESLKSAEGKSLEEERTKVENMRKQYDRIKGFAKNWKAKADTLQKQVAEKTKEAEDHASRVSELESKLASVDTERSSLEARLASAETSKSELGGASAAAAATLEKEKQDLKDRIEAETRKVVQLKEMNSKLLTGMKSLKQENVQLKDQLAAASADLPPATSTGASSNVTTDSQSKPAESVGSASQSAQPPPAAVTEASEQKPPQPTANRAVPPPSPPQSGQPPARSPLRTPPQDPPAIPTLKTTVTPPKPQSTPAAPAAIAVAPPATEKQATTVPATQPKTEAVKDTSSATPTVSAEEKLRLFALQSMKKQFLKAGGDAAGKPPAPSSQHSTSATASLAKPPVPTSTPEKKATSNAGDKSDKSSNPVTLGAFGSGGASVLVFGKPGITLPVPSSPTPVIQNPAVSTDAAAPPSAIAASSDSAAAPPPAESEAERRSLRLARFGAGASQASVDHGSAATSGATTLKRPAPASSVDAQPPKMQKTAANNDAVATAEPSVSTAPADAAAVTTDAADSTPAVPPSKPQSPPPQA
ncbi:hypothetical protein PINS_up007571 [Pythium insidiosum]|nr:hypothetical protein PINS_up007571 [Pythium insidiosum]